MIDWNALPWLLTTKQVRQITGLSWDELERLQREGVLHRHRPGRRGRYFKREIAILCTPIQR